MTLDPATPRGESLAGIRVLASWTVVGFVVAGSAIAIATLPRCSRSGSSRWTPPSGSTVANPADRPIAELTRSGTKVNLWSPDSGKVYVAVTSGSYDRFIDTVTARDDLGLTQMLNRREVFTVPSGTRALVLDRSVWSESVQVRILSGEHRGAAGWTSMKMVR